MTPLRSSVVCALGLAACGCHPDAVTNIPVTPTAGIHFVNAVPDTMQQDMRIVDIVSISGLFDADYRTYTMYYKGIEAGSREIKVFLSSIDPAITSQSIADTTFTFTQDLNYTFIHAGFARTGQTPARAIWIIQDNPPTPPAGQVAFRVINAGAGMGLVDVNLLRRGSDTLPDTPLLGGVAYGANATYLAPIKADSIQANLTTRVVTFYDTLRVVVTAAGTKTPVLLTVRAPLGVPGFPEGPAGGATNPIPGAAIPGSVLTVVIVPRSVAGSMAQKTAADTFPTALILVDKRPPNTAP